MPKRIEFWRPPVYIAAPPREREQAHYWSADWRATRARILIRDSYRCRACGRVVSGHRANVDHIVPLAEGGTDEDSNLQTLCRPCHSVKTVREQRQRGMPR